VVPQLRGKAGEQPLQTRLSAVRLLHELRGLLLNASIRIPPVRGPGRRQRFSVDGAHFIDISLTIAVPYVRRSHTCSKQFHKWLKARDRCLCCSVKERRYRTKLITARYL
jgi:hypothetical protein